MSDPNTACQIYLLTPPVIDDIGTFCAQLKSALATGHVSVLQIRLKETNGDTLDDSALIQAAKPIVDICKAAGVSVVLNDRPDLAAQLGADGAHIGQNDMDYFSSRDVLGGDAILGVTCHNSKELAFAAASAGADYVAFGAFFDTPTKAPKSRAELEILSWWQEAVEIPSVAIGGITVDNAAQIISAGADFIAVCSGVWNYKGGPDTALEQLSQLCLEHSPA
ncbi:MAG: thiamine phosphate synthase [Litorimonas sp.]